ncbi:1,2-phenylacetyl-CoA epoxidase subunit PaaC [Deinococcus alpinitundrae]|uniref:1,2-phenylacetyl-CoA epoxidase subunit PaaC n=1 Tax=Deinococcus alpinitundrae TaxID=468913 RepID=UPI00137B76A2|nr:1,2-phenylacetyl-CoA epoxidase subunit PaaC [Deinococcus alpinitundrae]
MTDLTSEQTQALILRLTVLADDELLLSHRDAEWTGHAPILEEDIALANIAQDELGHAMGWLDLRKTLDGSDPDGLAFRRGPDEFRNSALTELPKGDWAFTMVRQYLFDAYEALWQDAAKASTHTPLAQAAALALREERFHLQHTAAWVERLALGTPESERRTRAALQAVWPYALGLFEPLEGEQAGIEAGLLPDPTQIKARWLPLVTAHLTRCGLTPPGAEPVARGTHTEHLALLLAEFQGVNRQYAEMTAW